MEEVIKRKIDIDKLEFWGATSLFVFSIFILVTKALEGAMNPHFVPDNFEGDNSLPAFSYFTYYLIPTAVRYILLYVSYLVLVVQIIPNLIKKVNPSLNITAALVVFIAIAISFTVIDTWLKPQLFNNFETAGEVYSFLFKSNIIYSLWLIIMFGIYTIIKYSALYLLKNSDKLQAKYQLITRDGLIAFIIWMILFFLLLITEAPQVLLGIFAIIIPYAIILYWVSLYSLIPASYKKKRRFLSYIGRVILCLFITLIPLIVIIIPFYNNGEVVAAINTMNAAFQLLITAPLSWYIYRHRLSNTSELKSLKTALGVSTANLDLLRSQINPHFLFNALNTLYGTALQENAERTGEGIQRLGDMMRFMLDENVKDKITLNREIEYINNYISLQKLRTQSSPNIIIDTRIEEGVYNVNITPMLLIPFIENAFKHGISLREPSHIKISLQVKDKNLFFDVYNSIHPIKENDPEKGKSGIGLNNVKQRLKMFYPDTHELIIRQNINEFFVHLTIQLQ